MAKLSEILEAEKRRSEAQQLSQILLWSDGSFYRAYEWSAWLCVRYLKQFKVTKRSIKSVGSDMVFVGFPQKSLEKFILDGSTVIPSGDKGDCVMTLPDNLVEADAGSTLEQDYQNWRSTIPLTVSKEPDKEQLRIPTNPVSLTGIMKRIIEFPVESSTPIDCLHFIVELKKSASAML